MNAGVLSGQIIPTLLGTLIENCKARTVTRVTNENYHVVERFIKVQDYAGKPGKPTYDSIDLRQCMQGRRAKRVLVRWRRADRETPGGRRCFPLASSN